MRKNRRESGIFFSFCQIGADGHKKARRLPGRDVGSAAGVADMRKDVQFILKATSMLMAGCMPVPAAAAA